MSEFAVDAWVILDGENKPFLSYMDYDQAALLQQIGLGNAESIILKETTDRRIPESLTQGLSEIKDILVKLEPNVCIYLN